MENQLPTVSATDVLANTEALGDDANLKRIGQSDYIPLLAIASSLSESVDKGIARPGEWVLSKMTSLGAEIEVVPLAYRLHVALINKVDFSFVESKFVQLGEKPSDDYLKFCTMTPPQGHEIQAGADLFIYIPKVNSFAQIFMKKTLAKFVDPIWMAGKGGKLVKLATKLETNRTRSRKWYSVCIVPTQRALEISKLEGVTKDVKMDTNLYLKYTEQFRNPKVDAAETVGVATDDTIER
jgi:hypothetical protein